MTRNSKESEMAAPLPQEHDEPVSLSALAANLDVPKGYKVEIVDGNIIVSPTPRVGHAFVVSLLHASLSVFRSAGLAVVQVVSLELEVDEEQYIPDLLVVWMGKVAMEEWLLHRDQVALAVEVVSPQSAHRDRVEKLRGYGAGEVPLYLLIDLPGQTATLFSEPADGRYRIQTEVAFGETLHLPAPFELDLDTGELAQ